MENYRGASRKEMGFSEEDSYPLLVINSSDPRMPPVDMPGKDDILKYLYNNNFIGTHKTHSAMEKQGLLMV